MSKYLVTNEEYASTDVLKAHELFVDFRNAFYEIGVSFFDETLNLFDDNEVFEEYERRIVENYDESKDGSMKKYARQLENSSKKFRHFFANLVWLYNLSIRDKNHQTKVDEILICLQDTSYKNIVNQKTPQTGYINYGNLFQAKYYDINFIYYFSHDFIKSKENPNSIINKLNIIERMKEVSNESFKNMQNLASRHVLNYLFDSDKYEPIVSTNDKRKIITHFLGNYDDELIDEDLYKIREENFGFNDSLYSIIYDYPNIQPVKRDRKKTSSNIRTAILSTASKQSKNYAIGFELNNQEKDNIEDYKSKLENGILAEELVYNNVITTTDKRLLINKLYTMDITKNISNIAENIDKLIYYTKYYDQYSPFDLITTKNEEPLFVEVKSTVGNQIYFSKNEIQFAYEHQDNYEVRIVKNNVIYILDLKKHIQDLYNYIFDHVYQWQVESIKFQIEFL